MRLCGAAIPPVLTVALLGLILWGAPSARAEFGAIELVSKSSKEQAAAAVTPAISADGRYVAFAGQIEGRIGVFREDRQTGAVSPVVELAGLDEMRLSHPSISGDGRYIAFTTTEQLDPRDDTVSGTSDVYVADMASPHTYELVSAVSGCHPGVSPPPCGLEYAEPGKGSVAASRVAISEDGRRVAFLVKGRSNLDGLETPPGQVAVRDLDTGQTYLITTKEGTVAPVPGGGADAATEGAAISGDGTTVAWVGRHLPEQVPMLRDEAEAIRGLESHEGSEPENNEYHEPLWRRVPSAAEPNPAIRRVVGGGDPLALGCPPGGTVAEPACQGPFPVSLTRDRDAKLTEEGLGWGIHVPRLSADGDTLAVIGTPDEDEDLFVVNMAPGLSRRQAVRRLTHWVNPVPAANSLEHAFDPQYAALSGPIEDCAISPDGHRIAFTTKRQVFPLAPPTLITPAPPGTSVVAELYQVDLRGETTERATPGSTGTVSLAPEGVGGATAPSYSDEGRFLAFASGAYNLVAGDTNQASDAFLVESPPPASVESTKISPGPAALVLQPLWRITVATASLPNGRVRVTVGIPGAGAVRAKATAKLGSRLRKRRVAGAHRAAAGPGAQKLILHLSRKRQALARRKGGLYAQLDVYFEGPGGKPLHAALDARFLVHHRHKAKGKKG